LPQPKRRYTAEQIREARDIVYRIMMEHPYNYYRFSKEPNKTIVTILVETKSRSGFHKSFEFEQYNTAEAVCSDTDTWNDDVGRCVSLCNLTGETMPAWIRGERT
jgi:hypothetical protein